METNGVNVSPSAPLRILLVEDNQDFAKLVELFLRKHEEHQFEIVWHENGPSALQELAREGQFDAILMDYFLPGQNGLEITRRLQELNIHTPVIFLTVNKDFDLAVEVMKLGVEDYLVKEEISTPVLPRTILNAIERKNLKEQLTTLEVSQKRLEAIQELVQRITEDVRVPLKEMGGLVDQLVGEHRGDKLASYLNIIKENVARIERKIVLLKDLKSDKTVQYIKDIRMLDLSE